MDIIGGLLESNPSKRYTINDCLNHRWIKGDVVTVPKQKSFIAAKAKKQQSLKKLFLITEEPIDIEGTDNDEDESEGIGIDDVIDDEYVILNAPQNAIIKKGYLNRGRRDILYYKIMVLLAIIIQIRTIHQSLNLVLKIIIMEY